MIKGVKEIKGFTFADNRGTISEYNGFKVKSITHTVSLPNTLRGIHVQGWDKVVYVARGSVYTILYDDRKDSPTYKESEEFLMTGAYFIPKGVGNSYCVLQDEPVHYFYFNAEDYDKKKTYTISYKKFKWPIKNPIVSKQDEKVAK